uniref:Evolutionarily conserved signaling intermediate in Toll pathway, mitochondrial n=1 Tax=Alona affinis TaxID=381656 RepID=A0A9N6WW66_9CRUS|nr:EOG090X07J4 [Alona affinis]
MAACAFSCFLVLQRNLSHIRRPNHVTLYLRQVHRTAQVSREPGKNDHLPVVRTHFAQVEESHRNKDTFLEAIKIYTTRPGPRRGHVEFIHSALKHMEEFGSQRDLQAYKSLLDILPKGQYIATNMFQAEFFHYPKQQDCILDLLEKMEENGVCPDIEMENMMLNIFGRHARPLKKLRRMAYWMPKFKNMSPWALPERIPDETLELAKLAIARMGTVDPASEIEVFQAKEVADSVDDTWIVSGQSPTQRELLAKLPERQTVYVEGAFTIWLKRSSISYFILRAEPIAPSEEELKLRNEYDYDDVGQLRSSILGDENLGPKDLVVQNSVHEQEDGTILAIGITGTCSKDSLLSWIRLLERKNPHLANLSVLFTTYSPIGQVIPFIEDASPDRQAQTKITDGSND